MFAVKPFRPTETEEAGASGPLEARFLFCPKGFSS
jgi:hypothetical protein